MKSKVSRLTIGLAALIASSAGMVTTQSSAASAFSAGTGCGSGTGSAAGITAQANFIALPPCTGYIRVASICANSAGTNQAQGYGPVKSWGQGSSSRTCPSSFNASMRSWGWQISGTP
jgi:hypothetical protein